jgi:four helix bundle protein
LYYIFNPARLSKKHMGSFKELKAYILAFDLCMEIFRESKKFPAEEKFGLTSQMRRSSRSVCSNIAEGYRKRRYPAHFVSKLTDADMENTETAVWIDIAYHSNYIDDSIKEKWENKAAEIGKLLFFMINHHEKFC